MFEHGRRVRPDHASGTGSGRCDEAKLTAPLGNRWIEYPDAVRVVWHGHACRPLRQAGVRARGCPVNATKASAPARETWSVGA